MWLHICTKTNSTRQHVHVCGAVARRASLQHLHPCARGSSGVTRELWARVPVSQPYPRSHLESCPAAGVVLLILWELQTWVVGLSLPRKCSQSTRSCKSLQREASVTKAVTSEGPGCAVHMFILGLVWQEGQELLAWASGLCPSCISVTESDRYRTGYDSIF